MPRRRAPAVLAGTILIASVLGAVSANAQTVVNDVFDQITPVVNENPALITNDNFVQIFISDTDEVGPSPQTADVNQTQRFENDILIDAISGVAISARIVNTDIDFDNFASHENINSANVGNFSQLTDINQLLEITNDIVILDSGDGDIVAEISNESINFFDFFNEAEFENSNTGNVDGSLVQSGDIGQTNRIASSIVIAGSNGAVAANIENVDISLGNEFLEGINDNVETIGANLSQSGEVKQDNILASSISVGGPLAEIVNGGVALENLAGEMSNSNGGGVGVLLTQSGRIEQTNTLTNSIDLSVGVATISNDELTLFNSVELMLNENETINGNIEQSGEIDQTNTLANSIAGAGEHAEIGNQGVGLGNQVEEIINDNFDTIGGALTQTGDVDQDNTLTNNIIGAGDWAEIDNTGDTDLSNIVNEMSNSNGGSVGEGFSQSGTIKQANTVTNAIDSAGSAEIDNEELDLANFVEEAINENEQSVKGDHSQSIDVDQANKIDSSIVGAGDWAGINNGAVTLINNLAETSNDKNEGEVGGTLTQEAMIKQANTLASSIVVYAGGGAEIDNAEASLINDGTNGVNNDNEQIVGALMQSGDIDQTNKLTSSIVIAGKGGAEIDNVDAGLTNDASDGIDNINTGSVSGAGDLTQSGTLKQANILASSIVIFHGGAKIDNTSADLFNNANGSGVNNFNEGGGDDVSQSGEIDQANLLVSRIDIGAGKAKIDNEDVLLLNDALEGIVNDNASTIGGGAQSSTIKQANILASRIVIYEGGKGKIDNKSVILNNNANVSNSNEGSVEGDLTQSGTIEQANILASSIAIYGGGRAKIDNAGAALFNDAADAVSNDNRGGGVGGALMQSGDIDQANILASSIDIYGGGRAEINNGGVNLTNEASSGVNNTNAANIGEKIGGLTQSGTIEQANIVASSIVIGAGKAKIDNEGVSLTNNAPTGIANESEGSVGGALMQSGEIDQTNTIASHIVIDGKGGDAAIGNAGAMLTNDASRGISNEVDLGTVGGSITQSGTIKQTNTIASSIDMHAGGAAIDNNNASLANENEVGDAIFNDVDGTVDGSLTQSGTIKQANTIASSIVLYKGGGAAIGNEGVSLANNTSMQNDNQVEAGSSLMQGEIDQANTLFSSIDMRAGVAEIDNNNASLANDTGSGIFNFALSDNAGSLEQTVTIEQANLIASSIVIGAGKAKIDNEGVSLANNASMENDSEGEAGSGLMQGEIKQANIVASSIEIGAGKAQIDNEGAVLRNVALGGITIDNSATVDGALTQSGEIKQVNIVASSIDVYGGGGAKIDNGGASLSNNTFEGIANTNLGTVGGSLEQSGEIEQGNTLASHIVIHGGGWAKIDNTGANLGHNASNGIFNQNGDLFFIGSPVGGNLTQSGALEQASILASSIVIYEGGGAEIDNEGAALSNAAREAIQNSNGGFDVASPVDGNLTQSLEVKQANILASSIDAGAASAAINNAGARLRNAHEQGFNFNGLIDAGSPVGGSVSQSGTVKQANILASRIDYWAGSASIDNANADLSNGGEFGVINVNRGSVGGELIQSAETEEVNILASSITGGGAGSAEIDNTNARLSNDAFDGTENDQSGTVTEGLRQSAEIDQANIVASRIASGDGATIDNSGVTLTNRASLMNEGGNIGGNATQSGRIGQANTLASTIDSGKGGAEIDNTGANLSNDVLFGAAPNFPIANLIGGSIGGNLMQEGTIGQANLIASHIDAGTGSARIDNEAVVLSNTAEVDAIFNGNGASVEGDVTQSGKIKQTNTIASYLGLGAGSAAIDNKSAVLRNGGNGEPVRNDNEGEAGGALTQSAEVGQANTIASHIVIYDGGSARIDNEGASLNNAVSNGINEQENSVTGDATQSWWIKQANTIASDIVIKKKGGAAAINNTDAALANRAPPGVRNINEGSVSGDEGLTQSAEIKQVNKIASHIDIRAGGAKIDNEGVSLSNIANQGISNRNSTITVGGTAMQSATIDQANLIASSIVIGAGKAKIDNEDANLFNSAPSGIDTESEGGVTGNLDQSGEIDQVNTIASHIVIDGKIGGAAIGNAGAMLTNDASRGISNEVDLGTVGGSITQSGTIKQVNTIASSIDMQAGGAKIDNNNASLANENEAGDAIFNDVDGTVDGSLTQSGTIKQANTIASSIVIYKGGGAAIGNEGVSLANDTSLQNDNEVEAASSLMQGEIEQANTLFSSIEIGAGVAEIDNNNASLANDTGSGIFNFALSDNSGSLEQTVTIEQANLIASSIVIYEGGIAAIDNEGVSLANNTSMENDSEGTAGTGLMQGEIDQANTLASSIEIGAGKAQIDNEGVSLSNEFPLVGSGIANDNDGSVTNDLMQSGEIDQANTLASSIVIHGDGWAKIDNKGAMLSNSVLDVEQTDQLSGILNGNGAASVGGSVTQLGKVDQANILASHIVIADGRAEIDNEGVQLSNDVVTALDAPSTIFGVGNGNSADAVGAGEGGDLEQKGTVEQANTLASSIVIYDGGGAKIDNRGATLSNDVVTAPDGAGTAVGIFNGNSADNVFGSVEQSGKIKQANILASHIDAGAGGAKIDNQGVDLSNAVTTVDNGGTVLAIQNRTTGNVTGDLTQKAKIDQTNKIVSSIAIHEGGWAKINNENASLNNDAGAILNEYAVSFSATSAGSLTQSAKIKQSNILASSIAISGGGGAKIDNTGLQLTNVVGAIINDNLETVGGSLTQSGEVDQVNVLASSIAGAKGWAEIDNKSTTLENAVGEMSNSNGGNVGVLLTQSGKIKQANTVASSIEVYGGGAEIDNEELILANVVDVMINESEPIDGDLMQSGGIAQGNVLTSAITGAGEHTEIGNESVVLTNQVGEIINDNFEDVGGGLTQSGEIDQANTLASSIAGRGGWAGIENGEGTELNNFVGEISNSNGGRIGESLDQSAKVKQANTLANSIAVHEGAAEIDNEARQLTNIVDLVVNENDQSVEGDHSQSIEVKQTNTLANHIAGTGDWALIDNEAIELTNTVGDLTNDKNEGDVGGNLTQEVKLKQANTVASSIESGGGWAEIDNNGAVLINDAGNTISNDNEDNVEGGLTQSVAVEQVNTLASSAVLFNSQDFEGGDTGLRATIANGASLSNDVTVTNTNTGDVGGDIVQSATVDQLNSVESHIGVHNKADVSGTDIGILAEIDFEGQTLSNRVVGAGPGPNSQTNRVNSTIKIVNSGSARGGNIGIVADISNPVGFSNTAILSSATQTNIVTSDIGIYNSGDVHGGSLGIYASHLGASTSIVNSGKISAGNHFAIDTVGAATTIGNTGTITGFIDLTDQDDVFINAAGGVFETKKVSLFGGGEDLFKNEDGGAVLAATDGSRAERSGFVHLETFKNGGLISMQDGEEGDLFFISNTPGGADLRFEAWGSSTLAVDAFLGGPGSKSDLFVIDGDVSGKTTVDVFNTNPNGGAYNDDGIPVVFAGGNTPDENAFRLANGPIEAGLFDYDLFFEETNSGVWELRSFPGAGAHVLPQLLTAAQDLWHRSSSTWFDRTADLRVLLNNDVPLAPTGEPLGGQTLAAPVAPKFTPAAWLKTGGQWLDRDGDAQTRAYGRTYKYNLDRELESIDLQAGIDFGGRDIWGADAVVFGVLGGFVYGDLSYDNLARNFDYTGGQVGAYATYLNGGLFVDTLLNVHIYDIDSSTRGLPNSIDGNTVGLRTDAGYRFGSFTQGIFIEPLATLEVMWVDLDGFSNGGNRVSFSDDANVRGRLGLRAGTTGQFMENVLWEPFVIGSVWGNLDDSNTATVVSTGRTFRFVDDPEDVWGEVSAGVNFFNFTQSIAVFGKVDVQFGDDLTGVGGQGGMRVAW